MKVTRSVIPSLFTIMNLFSGFIAIKLAFVDGDFVVAGWFIVLGGLFDMLDGMMARLTHSSSEFGVELDSLADVVTFGVGPSAILYSAFFYQFGGVGLLLAALPAMCGAIRLARFNVQLVGFDKDYFKGLPIPSAAILIVSYVAFQFVPMPLATRLNDIGMYIVTVGASLLMVSTIKYDTMPKPTASAIKAHPLKFAVFAIGVIASIVTKGSAIFPCFVLFVAFGIARAGWERGNRFLKQRSATSLMDEEELEREEESTFGM